MNALVVNGWAIRITRKDKTTFLASSGCGTQPAVWCLRCRKWAVAHKRKLREHGFRCRVVRVRYMEPIVVPNKEFSGASTAETIGSEGDKR